MRLRRGESLCLGVPQHQEVLLFDLADPERRAVRITPAGWQITDAPAAFIRPPGILPLPVPVHGGHLADLGAFLPLLGNAITDWLVGAFLPTAGRHPLLLLQGGPRSGKTCLARMLRHLIDPHRAPLWPPPQKPAGLVAGQGWVLAFDHVPALEPWWAEALPVLCRTRPVLLSGCFSTHPTDLLREGLPVRVLTLPEIPQERRRPEAELLAAFEAARPRLLGGLLTAVAHAMGRNLK